MKVVRILNIILHTLLYLAVLFLFLFILIFAPKLKSLYLLYQNYQKEKIYISEAIENFQNKNYEEAVYNFQASRDLADYSVNLLSNLNFYIFNFVKNDILFSLNSFIVLDDSFIIFTDYLADLYDIYKDYEDKPYKDIPYETKVLLLEKLSRSPKLIEQIEEKINQAYIYVDDVNLYYLPKYNQLLKKYKLVLLDIINANDLLLDISNLIPVLAGYPDTHNYLFLLQNNTELRPTGGFIGTYAILKIHNGEVEDLYTKDVYSLDNPAGYYGFDKKPPKAFEVSFMNVHQWYFRDANWSPDFPSSAKLLKDFFVEEKKYIGETDWQIDTVIAINPRVIEDLIDFFGGIEVDGELYTKDNFIDLLEYKVEVDWHQQGLKVEERKDIVMRIAKKLEYKILHLPLSRYKEFVDLLQSFIDEKDIQIYSDYPNLEEIAEKYHCSGRVYDSKSDYIMLIDANLASLKTDEVMDKTIIYDLKEDNGQLLANIQVVYKNTAKQSWKHTKYNSYQRFYLPKNIVLKDNNLNLEISEDLGKTILARFIHVLPLKSVKYTFSYYLPNYIYQQYKTGNYCLYIQKQSGNNLNFQVIFNDDLKIKSYIKVKNLLIDKKSGKILISGFLNKDFEVCLDKL